MTVKRVMGTETEYAVSLNTPDRYNPVQLSFDVVNGAADSHSKSIRWDYRQEDPVNDARGTRLERAAARPDMLTDAPQLNITNVIAPNGGRVYVDHAHPEYSAPETTDPFEAVRYDHAGDSSCRPPPNTARKQTGTPIALHRNNVMARLLLGHARELYDGPRGAIRLGHTPDDPPLRHPPDLRRLRPRRDWREQRDPATSSASAPTTSTPKSACKPPSNARSSIRATNPTPPMHTAVCTSSSATPIAWRCRRH